MWYRPRFIESRDDFKLRVSELTTALANPTMIQYVDRESGQLVTTTSSRVRNKLQDELKDSKTQLAAVNDSITKLDLAIFTLTILLIPFCKKLLAALVP